MSDSAYRFHSWVELSLMQNWALTFGSKVGMKLELYVAQVIQVSNFMYDLITFLDTKYKKMFWLEIKFWGLAFNKKTSFNSLQLFVWEAYLGL